jgi:hypothetical protein
MGRSFQGFQRLVKRKNAMRPLYWPLLLSFSSELAMARSARNEKPTLTVHLDGGHKTIKSELVASHDLAVATRYGARGFLGQAKDVGVSFMMEATSATFTLNESSIISGWMDTTLFYKMQSFHMGLVISTLSMTTTKEAADLFELSGSGFGGTLGFSGKIDRVGSVGFDATVVALGELTEVNKKDVTIGSRTDVDLHLNLDITKQALDFVIGYRYRSLPVTYESSFTDVSYTFYLGLATSLFF